jgi:prepilin peptidase CpaA
LLKVELTIFDFYDYIWVIHPIQFFKLMIIIYTLLMVVLLMASIFDATTRKIPNRISLLILISGLAWNYFADQGLGLIGGATGMATGLMLMLPGHIFGSMGAGDTKLMAAIGSVIGFDKILDVVLYSYLVIFVMSLLFIILKGDLVKLLIRYKALFYGLFAGIISYQKPDGSEAAGQRLPLAPAIMLATGYVIYPTLCTSEFISHLCHF